VPPTASSVSGCDTTTEAMPVQIDTPVRVAFDTTVLWGAFHGPTGPNFSLLALAAQRLPMLDGFITDAVGAEFWWRATQQGIKRPGLRSARTYTEEELKPFVEAFAVLFEPRDMARAPMSRTLGRYAAMVGMPLGEALAAITGKDRDALLAGHTTALPMTFESVDVADLHVITGALDNGAQVLCSNDRKTLSYDPIGSMRVLSPVDLAQALDLMVVVSCKAQER